MIHGIFYIYIYRHHIFVYKFDTHAKAFDKDFFSLYNI